jgi:hypothetical protein
MSVINTPVLGLTGIGCTPFYRWQFIIIATNSLIVEMEALTPPIQKPVVEHEPAILTTFFLRYF